MAKRLTVEGLPDVLYHDLKVKAADEGTTIKALMIRVMRR